jgi:hypothetical protein
MQIVNTLYDVQTGSRGNDIHVTYTTYMVYDVQKCNLYGRLYDGFVRPWKWTFRWNNGHKPNMLPPTRGNVKLGC